MTESLRALTTDEAQDFAAARLKAARTAPYLSAALFSMEAVAQPGKGTFGVDRRWRLYIDPAQMAEWGPELTAGVLLHEVGHLIRDHAGRADRLGIVDPHAHRLWNLAGDAAINDDLLFDEVDLPAGRVAPADLGLAPHGVEEEYFHVLRSQSQNRTLVDCGSGADGRPREWEIVRSASDGGAGQDATGVHLPRGIGGRAQRVVRNQVARTIRETGRVPAGWQRWVSEVDALPTVDWRRELRAAVRVARRVRVGQVERSWLRPSRRHHSDAVLFPGWRRPLWQPAAVVDTSGSMTDAELGAILNEIESVMDRSGARDLWVVTCDARTSEPQRVRRPQDIRLRGGGGTDLRPAIEQLPRLRPRPDIAVVCTDGWTPWPDRPPRGLPVVVATTDRECPVPGFRNVKVEML